MEKTFCKLIKLSISRLETILDYPEALSAVTHTLIRGRQKGLTHRGEGDMKTKQRDLEMLTLRTGVRQPQDKECQSR